MHFLAEFAEPQPDAKVIVELPFEPETTNTNNGITCLPFRQPFPSLASPRGESAV